MLQGPIGPFFSELQQVLEAEGARTLRVLMNAGDVLFGRDEHTVRVSGSLDEYRAWLESCLEDFDPDTIILFGAKRPPHRIARDLAETHGIRVLSLEEGYLRSGYVTCEENGNNDLSPVCGRVPTANEELRVPEPASIGSNFKIMSWWGFLYFTTRIFFSGKADEPLIHRPLRGPLTEAAFWLRNIARLTRTKFTERGTIRRLIRDHDKDYLLVPLQMPSDSQMGAAARGWNIERLVDATLKAFVEKKSVGKLVFKLHPLDGHAYTRARMIREKAKAHGAENDIVVLHSGSIAELTIHSDGMMLINSTSGMTAIHHGAPLLVMGEAVYRHESLVHCGDDEADIAAFMDERRVAPARDRQRFEQFIAREALVPGDFYKQPGRDAASKAITRKILDYTVEEPALGKDQRAS